MFRYTLLILVLLLAHTHSSAQSITGDITDILNKKAMANVNIHNIHAGNSTVSDSSGHFSINAAKGELVEFRKLGYKTARIRIPQGSIPPYFKIVMERGPIELPTFVLTDEKREFKKDSVRYRELYKNALEFPELKGLDIINHPFSALSKRNRKIWAFQNEYRMFEQQKYIDYTFTEKLVTNLTGMKGDSALIYMKLYRPTYEQLRNMNEYTFYKYIKETVNLYRTGRRYVPTIRRSAG